MKTQRSIFASLLFAGLFMLTGCAVHFIAPYDSTLDTTMTQVQQDSELFFTQLQDAQGIATERTTQTITKEDAVDRLEMARDAAKCALDTQIGLATIAAEDAINAALGSVSSLVNGCIGFAVI